jgi:hypothetical protein
MSYGLNVEMQKQTEVGKRLEGIIRSVVPFLGPEVGYVRRSLQRGYLV